MVLVVFLELRRTLTLCEAFGLLLLVPLCRLYFISSAIPLGVVSLRSPRLNRFRQVTQRNRSAVGPIYRQVMRVTQYCRADQSVGEFIGEFDFLRRKADSKMETGTGFPAQLRRKA